MPTPDWVADLPAAVTVCDAEGVLIYMNAAAEKDFAKDGGAALIGSNLFDCHPPAAQEQIRALMRDRKASTYTVEHGGRTRLIHQSPWFQDGEFAGMIEITFDIHSPLPHFVR